MRKKQKRLLQERTILRRWGDIEKAPAGADNAAAVGRYRESSCGRMAEVRIDRYRQIGHVRRVSYGRLGVLVKGDELALEGLAEEGSR